MRELKLRPEGCEHRKFTGQVAQKLRQGRRKPASTETPPDIFLTFSEDPEEMPQRVAFCMALQSLPKYLLMGIWYTKNSISIAKTWKLGI